MLLQPRLHNLGAKVFKHADINHHHHFLTLPLKPSHGLHLLLAPFPFSYRP